MSTIETILSRAMSDSTFAEQLFADVEKALTGYSLTTEEIAKLKGMSRGELNAMTALAPEERKSMVRKAGEKPLEY
jgi:hypothetical protein